MVDCNKCKNLNITEEEQTDKKKNHICLKYKTRIYHNSYMIKDTMGKLYPCRDCWNDNYMNFEFRS